MLRERRRLDRFFYNELAPVPARLHVTCAKCGRDLTGVSARSCPECGKAFDLPIPPELKLQCEHCGYSLTGLTNRICPECGVGFDVKELLQQRRLRALDRWMGRQSAKAWGTGIAIAAIGFLVLVAFDRSLAIVPVISTPVFLAYWYRSNLGDAFDGIFGQRWPWLAIWLALSWIFVGMLIFLRHVAWQGFF